MPDVWGLASIATKFLTYFGVLGSAGLAFACATFHRETAGMRSGLFRLAAALAILALLSSGLAYALKGAALVDGISGMADPEMLGMLWHTPAGTALLVRGIGLALLLVGLLIPGIGIWISCAGGVVALWSFAQIGHVPETGRFWLRILLLLHLAGAAFWIGILTPLRRMSGDAGSLVLAASLGDRFGRIAVYVVPTLVLAGVVMAWRLLGEVSALFLTGYGLALLAKITVVVVLLGVAAANKLRFVPAMKRGDSAAAHRLRRSIAVEWVAIAAILLATATLTRVFGPPAQALP